MQVEWLQADLLNPESYLSKLGEVDTIIHAAGFISYQRKDRWKLMQENVMATRELVNNALLKGVRNLIFISSASTLIHSGNPSLVSLTGQGNPIWYSYYAKTKFLAELEIWRGSAEGLQTCILHPSLIIGHWDWNQTSMQIFGKVKKGLNYYPPGQLGLIAADDLAQIVRNIYQNEMYGGQYLVNAEVWSYEELLNEIAKNINRKPIEKKASKWQARLLLWKECIRSGVTGLNPIITAETLATSFTKFNYEITPLPDTIGISYRSIRQAIQEICDDLWGLPESNS